MSIRFNNDSKEPSGLVLLKLGLVLGGAVAHFSPLV